MQSIQTKSYKSSEISAVLLQLLSENARHSYLTLQQHFQEPAVKPHSQHLKLASHHVKDSHDQHESSGRHGEDQSQPGVIGDDDARRSRKPCKRAEGPLPSLLWIQRNRGNDMKVRKQGVGVLNRNTAFLWGLIKNDTVSWKTVYLKHHIYFIYIQSRVDDS